MFLRYPRPGIVNRNYVLDKVNDILLLCETVQMKCKILFANFARGRSAGGFKFKFRYGGKRLEFLLIARADLLRK